MAAKSKLILHKVVEDKGGGGEILLPFTSGFLPSYS